MWQPLLPSERVILALSLAVWWVHWYTKNLCCTCSTYMYMLLSLLTPPPPFQASPFSLSISSFTYTVWINVVHVHVHVCISWSSFWFVIYVIMVFTSRRLASIILTPLDNCTLVNFMYMYVCACIISCYFLPSSLHVHVGNHGFYVLVLCIGLPAASLLHWSAVHCKVSCTNLCHFLPFPLSQISIWIRDYLYKVHVVQNLYSHLKPTAWVDQSAVHFCYTP